jgi:hypothetical protein
MRVMGSGGAERRHGTGLLVTGLLVTITHNRQF